VQVTSSNDRSGFQIVLSTGKDSPIMTTLVPAGYFDPVVTRVIVIVTLRGIPFVLMDGIVTRQEVSTSAEPGKATLTITGEDLSVLMDLVEMPFMRFPGMPVVARVNAILAKYAPLGIVPVAIPPVIPNTTSPLLKLPSQKGTDRTYLREMASDCGYVFYVDPGPMPFSSIAYFGPDVRVPIPQPALVANSDADTNVESLSFGLDGLAKKLVFLTAFDPVTRKIPLPIPVPNISVLRPPLGARPSIPAKVEFTKKEGKADTSEAISRALAISFEASDAITGSGSLDVLRYGWILKSRLLVGVRGAGLAYDGYYYVNSVTHDIKPGEYKESFSISRDGLISPSPVVLP
jgi:hypothetical protein